MADSPQPSPAAPPRRRVKRFVPIAGIVVLVAMAVTAFAYLTPGRLPRNFAVVEAGRLYRSAQPLGAQYANAIEEYGIRTIVNLRNPDKDQDYVVDEDCAKRLGARVVRLPISSVTPLDAEQLATLRGVYDNPADYPILVHCEEGHARTGVAVAIWRIENQGWAPDKAVKEMIDSGYPVRDKNEQMRDLLLHWKAAKGE